MSYNKPLQIFNIETISDRRTKNDNPFVIYIIRNIKNNNIDFSAC